MSRDDDSLLSRWSRRKRAVAAEASSVASAPSSGPTDQPPEEGPQGTDEGHAPLSEPELLEKLGLPDPDSLTQGDDFKVFMQANVPDFLRRRALRRLWTSNPVLANLDGLIDHGEDYTDAAMIPEKLTTAYQVGKGILRRMADVPEPRETPDAPFTPPEAAAERDPESAETGPDVIAAKAEPGDDPSPAPRRMRFKTD